MEFPFVGYAEVSLGVSILILLLLLFGKSLRKTCAARWIVWVWLALALRLMIPYHFNLSRAPVTLPSPQRTTASLYDIPAFSVPDTVSGEERQAFEKKAALVKKERREIVLQNFFSAERLIPLLWGLGTLSVLTVQGVCYTLFRRRVKRRSTPVTRGHMVESLRTECYGRGMPRAIPLLLCPDTPGPMVTGFFRPVLLIPSREYSDGEIKMILHHEVTHIRHHHLWVKLVLFLACAIHWFNPLVWLMAREADRDLELACDDEVVRGRDASFREEYSRTILSLMSRDGLHANFSTCMKGNKRDLKRRFENILHTGIKRRGVAVFCAVVILGVSCGSLIACEKRASSVQTADTLWENRTEYIGDNSAVGGILSALPLPQSVKQKEFSLQTSKKPYGLTVCYTAESPLSEADLSWEYRNAMLLFSLISNADQVTFLIEGEDYYSEFQDTRDLAFRRELCDLRLFAQNRSNFEQFFSDLNAQGAADYNCNHMADQEPIRELTEEQAKTVIEQQYCTIILPARLQSRGEQTIAGVDCYRFDSVIDPDSSGILESREAISKDGCAYFQFDDTSVAETPLPSSAKESAQPFSSEGKTKLPMYTHKTKDPAEGAAYRAMAELYGQPRNPENVVIGAPIIYGSFTENEEMTVFTTVLTVEYQRKDTTLVPVGGSKIPLSLVFSANEGSPGKLIRFTAAKDGSYFAPSIRDFCGKYKDVAEKMIDESKSSPIFRKLMDQNIKEYVKQCGLTVKDYQTNDKVKHPIG